MSKFLKQDRGWLTAALGARRVKFNVDRQDDELLVHGPEGDVTLHCLPRFPRKDASDLGGGLTAPMPGKVLALKTSIGADVTQG